MQQQVLTALDVVVKPTRSLVNQDCHVKNIDHPDSVAAPHVVLLSLPHLQVAKVPLVRQMLLVQIVALNLERLSQLVQAL